MEEPPTLAGRRLVGQAGAPNLLLIGDRNVDRVYLPLSGVAGHPVAGLGSPKWVQSVCLGPYADSSSSVACRWALPGFQPLALYRISRSSWYRTRSS